MSSGSSSWDWLKPFAPLKHLYDWRGILGLIYAVFTGIASWFLGLARGQLIGISAAAAFALLFLMYAFLARNVDVLGRVKKMLKTSNIKKEEKDEGLRDLASIEVKTYLVIGGLSLALLAALAVIFYPPVYYHFSTREPNSVAFSQFVYHMPSQTNKLLGDNSFLEALIGSLTQEGEGEGKKYQMAIGQTVPFDHPTPQFQCKLTVAGKLNEYMVNGYAFLKRRSIERDAFVEVGRSFPTNQDVVFTVPPSEPGDELFVLARITLLKGDEFPADLKAVSSLTILNERKK